MKLKQFKDLTIVLDIISPLWIKRELLVYTVACLLSIQLVLIFLIQCS